MLKKSNDLNYFPFCGDKKCLYMIKTGMKLEVIRQTYIFYFSFLKFSNQEISTDILINTLMQPERPQNIIPSSF